MPGNVIVLYFWCSGNMFLCDSVRNWRLEAGIVPMLTASKRLFYALLFVGSSVENTIFNPLVCGFKKMLAERSVFLRL